MAGGSADEYVAGLQLAIDLGWLDPLIRHLRQVHVSRRGTVRVIGKMPRLAGEQAEARGLVPLGRIGTCTKRYTMKNVPGRGDN